MRPAVSCEDLPEQNLPLHDGTGAPSSQDGSLVRCRAQAAAAGAAAGAPLRAHREVGEGEVLEVVEEAREFSVLRDGGTSYPGRALKLRQPHKP